MRLPSVRTLKHYIDANLEEAGDCIEHLEDERKHYLAMVEKKDLDYKKLHQQGMCKLIHFTCTDSLHMYDNRLLYLKPESSHCGDVTPNVLPTGERILIIDEVKVCLVKAHVNMMYPDSTVWYYP